MNAKERMGDALANLVNSVESYAEMHRALYGSPVGEDGVIGELGVGPILHGLLNLLNGELGKQDGATLDRAIRTIAREHGFDGDDWT